MKFFLRLKTKERRRFHEQCMTTPACTACDDAEELPEMASAKPRTPTERPRAITRAQIVKPVKPARDAYFHLVKLSKRPKRCQTCRLAFELKPDEGFQIPLAVQRFESYPFKRHDQPSERLAWRNYYYHVHLRCLPHLKSENLIVNESVRLSEVNVDNLKSRGFTLKI